MIYAAEHTNQGGRSVNEDSYGIFAKGNGLCAVVADGLGSYGGGDKASRLAVNMTRDYYMAADILSAEGIHRCFFQINREIYRMQTPECKMKTTLAMLFVNSKQCMWAHVGDTRVYHFVDNRLKDITLDHSVPQRAVLAGEISPAEIRYHKDRNKLLRAMGYQEEVSPDISMPENMERGNHAFLLCTDGFWEYVEESDMVATLAQSQNPVEWMRKMTSILQARVQVRSPGRNDNNTAVAIWLKDE